MSFRPPGSERGVSPVVAEVMMVAVTVALAGATMLMAVGFAVNSLGVSGGADTADSGGSPTPPAASFDHEVVERSGSPDHLRITHAGGDRFDGGSIHISFQGTSIQAGGGPSVAGPADELAWTALGGGGRVEAGDEVVVEPPSSDPQLEGRTLLIVWNSGGESRILERISLE